MHSPNVLLIVLDSVRAQNTGLHGHSPSTTPYLDEFVSSATRYTQARAPSSWSLPSHASIFTGAHADEHDVHGTADRLDSGHSVFEELADDGYATGVFSENVFLTKSDNGLKDCFQHVHEAQNVRFPDGLNPGVFVFDEGGGQYLTYLKRCLSHNHPVKSLANGADVKLRRAAPWLPFLDSSIHTPGPVLAESFLDWTSSQSEPWAACINFMDAHTPYIPHELVEADATVEKLRGRISDYVWDFYSGENPWWLLDAMRTLYNDGIRQADKAVGVVLDGLREAGMLDDTLVVVTSDHGEGFGEMSEIVTDHHVAGHNRWTSEEVLHVPLVVRAPGQTEGRVETSLSSLTEFSEVVHAVRDGQDASFAVEQALASVHWRDEHVLHETVRDASPIRVMAEPARVVYENIDGGVRKFAVRDGREAVWDVRTATAKYPVDADASVVKDVFNDLVRGRLKAETDVTADADVMNRLEDLGYA